MAFNVHYSDKMPKIQTAASHYTSGLEKNHECRWNGTCITKPEMEDTKEYENSQLGERDESEAKHFKTISLIKTPPAVVNGKNPPQPNQFRATSKRLFCRIYSGNCTNEVRGGMNDNYTTIKSADSQKSFAPHPCLSWALRDLRRMVPPLSVLKKTSLGWNA
ncbi:hypothetical protein AVEN_133839-1 [Araneus ventricosus]|uniref:Uncharacterized protein n=1 Tax=Araneus ventricosus TaxID=182803 RepID=A0A4Y2I7L1_ARAVE|nr:hypothetical protein AVEN_133839-1 [Araneus ventricosus]